MCLPRLIASKVVNNVLVCDTCFAILGPSIAQWLERPTGILEGQWVRFPLENTENNFSLLHLFYLSFMCWSIFSFLPYFVNIQISSICSCRSSYGYNVYHYIANGFLSLISTINPFLYAWRWCLTVRLACISSAEKQYSAYCYSDMERSTEISTKPGSLIKKRNPGSRQELVSEKIQEILE